MVASSRQASHQQKRYGKHQKQTKYFRKVYWPYLPLIIIVIVSLFFNFNWQTRAHKATLPYATSISVSDLLTQTNINRANNGVASLSLNSQLNQAAQSKANDMIARNYWSHNTPDGQEPWVFISNAGYKYEKAGENLAYGFLTSSDTVAGWMNSAPHRANMLDSAFTEVGFGFANSSNFNNDGEETVVVAMYGKPAVLATTSSSQDQTSSPKPSASKTTQAKESPAPVPTSTPTQQEPIKNEQPVTSEQKTPIEPKTKSISRIQAITKGSVPWAASTLSLAAIAGFVVIIVKHGLALRRLLVRGERYVLHHLAFDATVMAFIGLVISFTRSAGFIR